MKTGAIKNHEKAKTACERSFCDFFQHEKRTKTLARPQSLIIFNILGDTCEIGDFAERYVSVSFTE